MYKNQQNYEVTFYIKNANKYQSLCKMELYNFAELRCISNACTLVNLQVRVWFNSLQCASAHHLGLNSKLVKNHFSKRCAKLQITLFCNCNKIQSYCRFAFSFAKKVYTCSFKRKTTQNVLGNIYKIYKKMGEVRTISDPLQHLASIVFQHQYKNFSFQQCVGGRSKAQQ